MKTIVHISDMHFGRIDPKLLTPLLKHIMGLQPNLLAVSGDLTQRARSHQFKEARVFLDSLPFPQIIVPGNHDVPLHNVFSRLFTPLTKYRRYITRDLRPKYCDNEMIVLGINSARSLTIKGGRIGISQIRHIQKQLADAPKGLVKIIVTHHPFGLPDGFGKQDLIGRAGKAMSSFAGSGVDVFLSGHLHVGHTGDTTTNYHIDGFGALIVQAGTATSTRHRGAGNSFNVLRVALDTIEVERFIWKEQLEAYASSSKEHFNRTKSGWIRSA